MESRVCPRIAPEIVHTATMNCQERLTERHSSRLPDAGERRTKQARRPSESCQIVSPQAVATTNDECVGRNAVEKRRGSSRAAARPHRVGGQAIQGEKLIRDPGNRVGASVLAGVPRQAAKQQVTHAAPEAHFRSLPLLNHLAEALQAAPSRPPHSFPLAVRTPSPFSCRISPHNRFVHTAELGRETRTTSRC